MEVRSCVFLYKNVCFSKVAALKFLHFCQMAEYASRYVVIITLIVNDVSHLYWNALMGMMKRYYLLIINVHKRWKTGCQS